MKTFQIITDSSCDLPQELSDKLELLVLPLHFTIGGKTYANYLDGREIGFHDFFERIRQGEAASTSAVNPESFREVMEQTLQQGLDILFVGFSSGLSTTYQSGCIAADDLREKYPERTILTVDSLCASLGQGLLVHHAVQKKNAGASIEELAQYLEDNKLPGTTKKESGHGMGFANVQEVLRKYGAEYTVSCRDRWFRFTCAIPVCNS